MCQNSMSLITTMYLLTCILRRRRCRRSASRREQNRKLTDTQRQFEIVNAGIIQSRDKTAVIKSAIGECNQVRNTVSEIMLNLSAISEENAASATETATAMQQLNGTITELLRESEKLMMISAQLEQDMMFFKL